MAPGISVQLLILVTFAWLLIAPIHGQLDSLGFISIDCGIPENSSYSDQSSSGLLYVSDFGFIDVGLNGKVNPPYNKRDMADRYITVRYFPDGTRNCYTLQPLVPARKYLVRATFYYGNYDGLNMFPVFDLYLGVNHWTTVNITTAGSAYVLEMVAVSPADYIQVCLVNTGLGTPFISGLDLRPLKAKLYPEATANRSLSLLNFFRPPVANFGFNRYQFWGPIAPIYRYPYDPYDRIWQRYDNPAWTNLTKSQAVQTSNITNFDVPSLIMRSATTPLNGTQIAFSWSSDPSINNGNTTYLLLLYFAELEQLPSNALRQFDILVDNATANGSQHYTPKYLSAEAVSRLVHGSSQHSVSLVATPNATLPPILNAFEIYSVQQLTGYMTNIRDAKAMMTIRMKFGVKRNWMGDPCAPKVFSWDGLNCSNSSSGLTWITALNLSSSGLTGAIDASFGDLKSLQYLNLSNNNLSGPIPDFLAQMPSLKFLDLSSNKLSGSIPAVLQQKSQNGSLSLRFGNNANLCGSGTSTCKHKTTIIVIATVVLVAIATLMFIAAVLFLHRMRNKQASQMVHNPMPKSPRDKSTIFDNRQFTYKELKLMTDNFREEIGQGGFGTVFLGHLEDGTTPVAVKICSRKTLQGDKEFSAEAQHLGRVHHKNLVSLIGYCKDKKHLGLVYEFMHGGNLEDHLRCISTTTSSSEASIVAPLNWHQRLKIALDSAQGLEYLHKSCQPPLIHRDVKTRNILLSAALEAKIADFGLTRALTGGELATHVTTQPAGTLGYLDPEYYNTSRLSEKSDVYSFGVVLLELLTGLPASVPVSATERIHVAQWTRQRLAEGSGIESVVDPRMGEHYDINSAWKVAELALRCKELPSRDRPTMADVVAELRESLELEASFGAVTGSSTEATDMSAVGDDQWWRHGVGAGNLDELNVADAE